MSEYEDLSSKTRHAVALDYFRPIRRVGGACAPSSHRTVRTGPYTALHANLTHC
jgi:hypothetical protein